MGVRQLITNFNASFEQFVNKIENHEAIAEQTIARAAQAAAQVRREARRNGIRSERLREALTNAQDQVVHWERRAVALPESAAADAIECLARADYEQTRVEQLSQQLERFEKQASALQRALSEAEARLSDLKLRRSDLVTRAQLTELAEAGSMPPQQSADELFDRWETAIDARELGQGVSGFADSSSNTGDAFEERFEQQERSERLRERLQVLRASAKSVGPGEAG